MKSGDVVVTLTILLRVSLRFRASFRACTMLASQQHLCIDYTIRVERASQRRSRQGGHLY